MKKHKPAADAEVQKASGVRLDKWLWAARFFKTRALSAEAIEKGRVLVNGHGSKAGKDARVGDTLQVKTSAFEKTVVVKAISGVRGSAPVAALLYEETAASIERRTREAENRRLAPEPAHTIDQGRPTKRDRRTLSAWRGRGRDSGDDKNWNDRWSASVDE
ncbi:S4 domain-containing protein [Hydrogenophaga sp. 5NK40-0174]|uniref:RNA-binding S4 domain-containing protein n=1 Tax=Hydrogenophaga sp. 5NK40-0174 TaxID=3127649 RepID=UPI00310A967D